MPHRPHRVLLASLALVLLCVLAAWTRLGGPDVRRDVLLNPPPEGGRISGIAAQPTPEPPPWTGSVLAAALPRAEDHAIALLDVGAGSATRLLVEGFDEIGGLSWSPDDRVLAFAGLRDTNWDIYRVNRDGTGLVRLTEHPGFEASPTWSPDGREIAFVSYRDGNLAIYALTLDPAGAGASIEGASTADASTGDGAVRRITHADGPTIEPAWSPDGRWIAFAAWHDGAYRIEALALADGAQQVASVPAEGVDFRAPAWSPGGGQLACIEQRHGLGRLVVQTWAPRDPTAMTESATVAGSDPAAGSDLATVSDVTAGSDVTAESDSITPPATAVAERVSGYGWFPGGEALAVAAADRSERVIEIRSPTGASYERLAPTLQGATHLAWSRGSMPADLPLLAAEASPHPVSADGGEARSDARPGLVRLVDVAVAGDRIHAGLAEDFAALRAELRVAVGRDFLGTLSDSWRPLGFASSGSAFFSWHKTGRAFDTQMELRGPGGRRDMVLVRDEANGRTMWRMFLRAEAQDGSVGRPLTEPGWTFAAGSGDPELAREGGRRAGVVPAGYWVDFTALAEGYGWRRIPSLTQGRLDWHRDWEAIEYWHYERRDGLRWFEAARQVYTDEELASQLHPDRLAERSISLQRLGRLGFPAIWPPGG